MTIDELQKLTSHRFEFVIPTADGHILFAGPLPDEYGKNLPNIENLDETGLYAWEDAWERYISSLTALKQNRTKKQAIEQGAITEMPKQLAIPTLIPYQDAMSTVNNPAAHLQPITQALADNLRFEDGTLYFQGMEASYANLIEYYDKRPQAVSELDLPTLRALYSVILQELKDAAEDPDEIMERAKDPKYLSHSVKLYLPDVMKMLGYKQNSSKDGVTYAVAKIMRYNRILGVMEEKANGRVYRSHYPVMLFVGHDGKDNSIELASPYINKLVMTVLHASIQRDKNDKPKLKRNGKPFMLPSHSYLINASIAKERNKRAVEIVCIVVTLIEQAGDSGTPHIRAQTIIDRCPDLKNALDAAASSNKSLILKRAFSKAWQLLPKQTRLAEVYRNIKFPTAVPTASTLDMVFEFPHDGKIKPEKTG